MTATRNIIIVDDAPLIQAGLSAALKSEGFDVVGQAATALEAVDMAKQHQADLMLLDVLMPGISGLDVCRTIRAESDVPIVMVTAKDSEADKVTGLELGADDYVTKPFSIRELLARVRALFRRVDAMSEAPAEPEDVLQIDGLSIDPWRRRVLLGDTEVHLTSREFDLLLHFARHPGQVFSRTQLLDSVWGYGHEGYEHTVNSHINRLRAKIEADPTQPRYIRTVWGVGYKFPDREDWAEG